MKKWSLPRWTLRREDKGYEGDEPCQYITIPFFFFFFFKQNLMYDYLIKAYEVKV